MDTLSHLTRMALAAGICTAMICFGLLTRRRNGSRRWVFVIAGLLSVGPLAYTVDMGGDVDSWLVQSSVAAVSLVAGIAIAVIARRGKRVGDHPHCRRCGFDLTGRPAGSDRCSECGTVLNDQAIVIGELRRNRGLVLAAIFLMLFAATSGLPVLRRFSVFSINWYQYKRTPTLLAAMHTNRYRPEWIAASRELSRRMAAGELSDEETRHWIEQELDVSTGPPDNSQLSPLIVSYLKRTKAIHEALQAILRTSNPWMHLDVVNTAVRGKPIHISDSFDSFYNANWLFRRFAFLSPIAVTDARVDAVTYESGRTLLHCTETWNSITLAPDNWSQIPDGQAVLERSVHLTVTLDFNGKTFVEPVTWTDKCPITIVTPATQPSATMPATPH